MKAEVFALVRRLAEERSRRKEKQEKRGKYCKILKMLLPKAAKIGPENAAIRRQQNTVLRSRSVDIVWQTVGAKTAAGCSAADGKKSYKIA